MAGSFDTFLSATRPLKIVAPAEGGTGTFDSFLTATQPFREVATTQAPGGGSVAYPLFAHEGIHNAVFGGRVVR